MSPQVELEMFDRMFDPNVWPGLEIESGVLDQGWEESLHLPSKQNSSFFSFFKTRTRSLAGRWKMVENIWSIFSELLD